VHRQASPQSSRISRQRRLGGDNNTNKKDDHKTALLREVTSSGYERTIQQLLKQGADVVAENSNGWTALHRCTERPNTGTRRRCNYCLRKGLTLWWRLRVGRRRYSSQQKMEVARLLLENGAGVTTKDDDERTALYRTANRGIRRCCSSCSRRRANVAAKDDKGLTSGGGKVTAREGGKK
jgi:ankyrin repeat protein